MTVNITVNVLCVIDGKDKGQVQLYESDILTDRETSKTVDFMTQSSCI